MSEIDRLHRAARRVRGAARLTIPALFCFTDPARTPDVLALAGRVPRGAALVYRAFGAENRVIVARVLSRLARRRGFVLLIGADERLAKRVDAHGVHLPARMAHRAGTIKRRWPASLVTLAAHNAAELRVGGKSDALVLSPIFKSRSASAGEPLFPRRAGALARGAPRPVIALGGVTVENAGQLRRRGFAGIAGIDAFQPR